MPAGKAHPSPSSPPIATAHLSSPSLFPGQQSASYLHLPTHTLLYVLPWSPPPPLCSHQNSHVIIQALPQTSRTARSVIPAYQLESEPENFLLCLQLHFFSPRRMISDCTFFWKIPPWSGLKHDAPSCGPNRHSSHESFICNMIFS